MALKKYQEHHLIDSQKKEMLDRAKRGLLAFTLHTKPDYEINWHHRYMCSVINKFIRREITHLMVFMPPRHGKSELTSRRLPAMLHGLYPDDQILTASYSGGLASDMCRDTQRIIDSEAYAQLFPNTHITPEGGRSPFKRSSNEHRIYGIREDKEGKEVRYHRGIYRGGGINGAFTGRGANWLLIDDPFKNESEANSIAFRKQVWSSYQSSLLTRLEKLGSVLITMTRWHEDDLAGRLKEEAKEHKDNQQWTIIDFPAIKETMDNPEDPRGIDEPLWPNKYDKARLGRIKRSVGTRSWNSLYQQRPTALEGGIIKRSWIKYWTQKTLPKSFHEKIQSWDLTFKKGITTDYVVGQVWGRIDADKYLIWQFREQVGFVDTINGIKNVTEMHPDALLKLVEEKANGSAVMDVLKGKVSGIVGVNPTESKESRLHAVSPEFEGGNVYIPDPSIYPWVKGWVDEICTFPNGVNDDQVDSATQALKRLGNGASFDDILNF